MNVWAELCCALQVGDGTGFDPNTTVVVLNQTVYNNTASNSSLTATVASTELTEQTASWSRNVGLDNYLSSIVNAALPQPSANTSAVGASA